MKLIQAAIDSLHPVLANYKLEINDEEDTNTGLSYLRVHGIEDVHVSKIVFVYYNQDICSYVHVTGMHNYHRFDVQDMEWLHNNPAPQKYLDIIMAILESHKVLNET